MRTVAKTILLTGLFLIVCLSLPACNGGEIKFVVGEINGPLILNENSSAMYSVKVSGDTGITYQWLCNIPELGKFESPNSSITKFSVGAVIEDTPIEISILINSGHYPAVFKAITVNILAEEDFYVSGITGPATVDEYSTVNFNVETTSDKALTYEWYCDPSDAGVLDPPDSPSTQFTPANVNRDTTAAIHVKVESDGCDPVKRDFGVVIKNTYTWAKTWGGESDDRPTGVAVDSEGNAYVTGNFKGSVDFDPSQGEDVYVSPYGWAVFLSKFNPQGEYQWTRAILPITEDPYGYGISKDIAIDHEGNIYVVGYFHGIMDFDPGSGEDFRESYMSKIFCKSAFLCSFSSNGVPNFALTWGGPAQGDIRCLGNRITLDGSGNIYMTGEYLGDVDFDPGMGVCFVEQPGESYDAFLVKIDSYGGFLWASAWGGDENDRGLSVSAGIEGNIYVGGYFSGTVDFDPGPGTHEVTAGWIVQPYDGFLCSFSADGGFIWVQTWENYGDDLDTTTDNSGYVYATMCNSFGTDRLVKYSSSGTLIWMTESETALHYYNSIAVDSYGNLIVTGYIKKTSYDVLLRKFNDDGSLLWSHDWGEFIATDEGRGVAVTDTGEIYVTGTFRGYADLDPGPGWYCYSSNGGDDIFLSRLNTDGEW